VGLILLCGGSHPPHSVAITAVLGVAKATSCFIHISPRRRLIFEGFCHAATEKQRPVWACYSPCQLVNQGGALCSPRDNFQMIEQSVPKRQPTEALITLDRRFES